MNEDIYLEWETLEHPYFEKTSNWYWLVGIVGITVAALGVIFGNILFAVVMAIATFAVMLHGARRPRIIIVAIDKHGVYIAENYFRYTELKSFSIDDEADIHIVTFKTNKAILPEFSVVIEDYSSEDVRDFLLDHLDEEYHQPSISVAVGNYLGF